MEVKSFPLNLTDAELLAEYEVVKSPRNNTTSFALACTIGPFKFKLWEATSQPEDATPTHRSISLHSNSSTTRLRHMVCRKDPHFAEKLEATGELVDDIFLNRWIQVKKYNLEEAAAALMIHVNWRVDFVTTAYRASQQHGIHSTTHTTTTTNNKPHLSLSLLGPLPEASMMKELQAEKVFLQGCDRHGHPVVIIKAAKHDMRIRDLEETNRLIAYTLDNAALAGNPSLDPNARLTCILDLAGLAPRNCDYKALLAIFEMLQHQYPERLSTLYFLNAPFIFWGVWRIVSPFVPPGTRAKLRFVSGETARATLVERIEEDVLPGDMGGRAVYVPIDAAVAQYIKEQSNNSYGSGGGGWMKNGSSDGHHHHHHHRNNNNYNNANTGKMAAIRGAASAAGRFVNKKVLRPMTMLRLPHHHNNNKEKEQWEARYRGGVMNSGNNNNTRALLERVLLPGLLLSIILNVIREAWMRARGLGSGSSSSGGKGRGRRRHEKLMEIKLDEDGTSKSVGKEESGCNSEDDDDECHSSDSESIQTTHLEAEEEDDDCSRGMKLTNKEHSATNTIAV